MYNLFLKQQKKDNPLLQARKRYEKALEGLKTTPELDQNIAEIRIEFEQRKEDMRLRFNSEIELLALETCNKEIDIINRHKDDQNKQEMS